MRTRCEILLLHPLVLYRKCELEKLILTHMLQTEMKSKVNAFKKRLQREPTFPDVTCSSQTRMTHTVAGSLPARGSFRGGRSVI